MSQERPREAKDPSPRTEGMVTLPAVGSNYPLQPVAGQSRSSTMGVHAALAVSFASSYLPLTPGFRRWARSTQNPFTALSRLLRSLPSFFTLGSPYSSFPHYGPCPIPCRPRRPLPHLIPSPQVTSWQLNLGPASLLTMAPVPP